MIIDELKKANMDALKNKDQNARTILSILINKIQIATVDQKAKGKTFADGDAGAIINKTKAELLDERASYEKAGNKTELQNIDTQLAIVGKYLAAMPAGLTMDEIKAEITKLADKNIGVVMKHFKEKFGSRCDMKMVGEALKTL